MRPLILTTILAMLVGCGGSGSSSSSEHRPVDAVLPEADTDVLSTVGAHIDAWNAAANPWSAAYKAGDRTRFLRVQAGYVERMNRASVRIAVAVERLGQPRLRARMQRLADVYRRELRAIVSVSDTVLNADLEGGQRAVARLQRAVDEKIRIVGELSRSYPQLR